MEKIFLKKGVADCKIVIPDDAHIVEKTASEELVNYIEKALSVKLPIVNEKKASGKCIYVGQTEYAKAAGILGKSMENWIIAMHEDNLVLTGGVNKGERGIIYAVYHFLEDMAGVRWWNPYEEDILSLEKLSLDENLYREGTPCFVYRKPFMNPNSGPQAFPYSVKSRVNSISPLDDGIADSVYDETVRKYGGARMAGRPHHVHTMGKYFPAAQYYDEHPEWWAWNKAQGKHIRVGSYCFANEGLFRALLDKLLAYIREDVELAEKTGVELPVYYSISVDDVNENFFCQCDECTKAIEESGYTGYVLRFVNKIAREVAKIYPFAKIEILVYMNFIEPPKDDTLPEKNCVIRLADLFSDLLRDINAPINANYLRLLKAWSEICKKAGCELHIYDYMYNICVNYPLPLFYRVKNTIKAYKEYGVSGVFTETHRVRADSADINKYVLVHLLEDPDTDADALIDDCLKRYYGNAAQYVKAYYELLLETSERNHMRITCTGEDSRFNYIDVQTAVKGSELLDKAKKAVGSLDPFARRVNWLRKHLDAVMSFKYFELKKMAEDNGEQFDFDIRMLKARVISALEEFKGTPIGRSVKDEVDDEILYFSNLPEEAESFDIPEELQHVDAKDICQFSLVNMPKFVWSFWVNIYAYSAVEDKDSKLSKVMQINNSVAKGIHVTIMMNPSSRDAEAKRTLDFKLQQDGKNVVVRNYYKEDLIQGGYHLYYLGSLSGIAGSDTTRVSLCGGTGSINLSGLAVTFPMDACDVYLSMKFTGEMYGGKPQEDNAIYFERMIIVRK